MSQYLDTEYLNKISPRLDRFKKTSSTKWRLRCPFCGDSQRSKFKARGGFFSTPNGLRYNCFNCNESSNFGRFLKQFDEHLYRDYVKERYANSSDNNDWFIDENQVEIQPIKRNILKGLPSLFDLFIEDRSHPAVQYMKNRRVTFEKAFESFFWTDSFGPFVNQFVEDKLDEDAFKDGRIIIPMTNLEGDVFGFQGRAIDNNSIRYLSRVIYEGYHKSFNGHNLDHNKPIWIVEGPMDAVCLPNALAALDSDLRGISKKLGILNPILAYDNEQENKEIVQKMQDSIENGYRVLIWPDSYDTEEAKDISGYIKSGISIGQLWKDMKMNVYQGTKALLKFNEWKNK